MDTKNENQDILELLEKAWNEKDSKIVILMPDQEKEIRQMIRSRRITQSEKLFRRKTFMLAFCGLVMFYLLANLRLYITEIKYFLPFVGLTLVFGFSIFYYAWEIHLILNIEKHDATSKDVAMNVTKLRILEKKEMIYSLAIALPVLIACVPPISSLTFNRLDFYQNITAYLPLMILAVVLSFISGYIYYRKNMVAIQELADIESNINAI